MNINFDKLIYKPLDVMALFDYIIEMTKMSFHNEIEFNLFDLKAL